MCRFKLRTRRVRQYLPPRPTRSCFPRTLNPCLQHIPRMECNLCLPPCRCIKTKEDTLPIHPPIPPCTLATCILRRIRIINININIIHRAVCKATLLPLLLSQRFLLSAVSVSSNRSFDRFLLVIIIHMFRTTTTTTFSSLLSLPCLTPLFPLLSFLSFFPSPY